MTTNNTVNHRKQTSRWGVTIGVVYMLFAIFMLTACVNDIGHDGDKDESDTTTLPVNINTRTQVTDIAPTLPIRVYAFDSRGICTAHQTLTTASEDVVLQLPLGSYIIYALTGATDTRYTLPKASAVTAEHLITLRDGHTTHGELEAGKATITLENGRTTDLTLTVTRIVAQATASITGLPEDVTAVTLVLEHLYTAVRLNGVYETEPLQATFALEKGNDGIWSTPTPLYLLPAEGDVTVTIKLTDTNGTHSYDYNSTIKVEANHKIEIAANYTEAIDPVINGSIKSTDWEGTHNPSSNFGPSGSSGNNSQPVANLPDVGTLHQECYVLAVTDVTTTSANLLLVAPKEWTNVTKEKAEETISAYTTGTLSGWVLPNRAQARMLYNARSKIEGMSSMAGYLFNDEGIKCCFETSDPSFTSYSAYEGTPYHIRAVKAQAVNLIINK